MFIRSKKTKDYIYLQLVESKWVDGRPKQVVLKSLGRLDTLQETGQLDGLLRSGMRFSKELAVLDAHKNGQSVKTKSSKTGAAIVFEKIWKELRIPDVLKKILKERKFGFSVERSIFATVLHRIFSSGSDRACDRWKKEYKIEGVREIGLHQLYRGMWWLGEELAKEDQEGATPFSPRCNKDIIEEELFETRRDLFTDFELVFFDTTSIYFEGEGGESLGEHGKSKDHRPDLKQMAVGIILDSKGNPVCSELWPGNTTDVKSLTPVATRLKTRFRIQNICIVADRGMVSEENKREIEGMGWKYILGARMRRTKEVKEEVLGRAGRYEEVYPARKNAKDPSPLKVKEVDVEGRRYVVCLNEEQAKKDRYDREAIVDSLREALKSGDKSLVGNKGYRKYLESGKDHFKIDEEKIKEEERYDGKWVLTTNTDFTAKELAIKYKQLWMVEEIFRSMKTILETRPIYHKCDETIRGHVFCSFLALLLRKKLQDAIEEKGWQLEWADIIHDLDNFMEMEIKLSGKEYIIRSEVDGTVGKVFQAARATIPPKVVQK